MSLSLSSKNKCKYCNSDIIKDVLALNKKLLGRKIVNYLCLDCLSEYIDCSKEDLNIKIDEFKESGCGLFK